MLRAREEGNTYAEEEEEKYKSTRVQEYKDNTHTRVAGLKSENHTNSTGFRV